MKDSLERENERKKRKENEEKEGRKKARWKETKRIRDGRVTKKKPSEDVERNQ